jgi:hypothetical protein
LWGSGAQVFGDRVRLGWHGLQATVIGQGFGVSQDQVQVSFENLCALGLAEFSGNVRRTVHFTAKGRELMRVATG